VRDLVVEEVRTGFTGAVVRVEAGTVELEDWKGRVRAFPLGGSFLIDGSPVALRVPRAAPQGRARTASGSFAVEGVVVEYLEGVDHLAEVLAEFRPTATRRVGVLVDHLVTGSKESRIAESIARGPSGAHVLVVGHPFVDVWQAVRPGRLGLEAWPTVPRSVEWKHGICEHLGWPHDDQADIAAAWQRILGRVRTFGDLEPALLGRVEQLIDFVTVP
jgi:hypothetical protein